MIWSLKFGRYYGNVAVVFVAFNLRILECLQASQIQASEQETFDNVDIATSQKLFLFNFSLAIYICTRFSFSLPTESHRETGMPWHERFVQFESGSLRTVHCTENVADD